MSEELTFRADRMRAVLLLPVAIAFVVGGYSMRAEKPLIAWAMMICFGLFIPVVLMQIFRPKSAYLRLDAEGFEIRTSPPGSPAWKAPLRTTTRRRWKRSSRR